MTKTSQKIPADYITPFNINGLHGRMLSMPLPPGRKREILFVYGHHSSLERWWGLVEHLSQYGAVTMPDLPGLGGMDSFYSIGKQPSFDNFADYLATYIKLRYKRKRITIVGLSFGFVVVTRMLQRYPDLAKKVDLLVSVVGFAHHSDFTFSRPRRRFYIGAGAFFSYALPAALSKVILLNPVMIRLAYAKTHNAKDKFSGLSKAEHKATTKFEIELWRINDLRTQSATTRAFFTLDNCQKKIDLPVWHVSVKADRYFDSHSVEQHMRIIFNDYHAAEAQTDNHAPSILADKNVAAKMIPLKIRQLLAER